MHCVYGICFLSHDSKDGDVNAITILCFAMQYGFELLAASA